MIHKFMKIANMFDYLGIKKTKLCNTLLVILVLEFR